jgi:hypothetical protein
LRDDDEDSGVAGEERPWSAIMIDHGCPFSGTNVVRCRWHDISSDPNWSRSSWQLQPFPMCRFADAINCQL